MDGISIYFCTNNPFRCSTPCIVVENAPATQNYVYMNPYANAYANTYANSYAYPYGHPHANQFGNPYANQRAYPYTDTAYVNGPAPRYYPRRTPKYNGGHTNNHNSNKKKIPVDVPAEDFTQCSLLTILLNRFIAETNRKHAFSSIYEGPISNLGKTRKDS